MQENHEVSLARCLVLAALVFAADAAGVARVLLVRSWQEPYGALASGTSRHTLVEAYDESVSRVVVDLTTGATLSRTIVRPATTLGLVRVWWPAPACLVVTGAALAMAATRRGRRLLSSVRPPRLTMLQCMAAIGALSVWLWLYRINWLIMLCGVVVLVLIHFAASRRGRLAGEIGREGASALSRAGLVGYSVAALLGLAWIGCILVWESYERIGH